MKKSYNTTYPCDPASHCEVSALTRHCEKATAYTTRHSEGATATEESTAHKESVNLNVDSSLSTKAQNDGLGKFKDGTARHSEGATATEESTNGKACVNLNVDSSLRATHSAQNDGIASE